MSILVTEVRGKNLILLAILAGVLLFPLAGLLPSTTMTQITMMSNYVYAEPSSNEENSSSMATSFDAKSSGIINNSATQITNQDSNINKMIRLESASNNTITSNNTIDSSKQQSKNDTIFISNTTNFSNVTGISNTAAQGPSGVTGDFNGDGSDDLAIGVPFEDEEIGGSTLLDFHIASVTASGNDGNLPQNVLDSNLGTRWSSLGIGQFITADLGSIKKISNVDIAWYKGNERQYHFVIATSTDGTTFTNRLNANSSGTTASPEAYTIPFTSGRYVKVTVNGNTQNDWASITELDILGPSPSHTIFDSGAVNVVYGTSKGLSPTTISQGDGRADQIWTQAITAGIESSDAFGYALATGDFDNDGFTDLAIGVPREDIGTDMPDAGAINVIYGSSTGLSATGNQVWTQNSQGIQGRAGAGDWFGYALATGDFDNDGFSDLAIGVPREWVIGDAIEGGVVNIIYGSSAGLNATAKFSPYLTQLDVPSHPQYSDIEAGDWFGATLTTGYFNDDGYSDLAVGAPREDVGTVRNAGQVDVYHGSSEGLNYSFGDREQTWRQNSTGLDYPEDGDLFGSALTTGDFDKDGISDLAIGVIGEDVNPIGSMVNDAGAVNVIYGSLNGLQVIEYPPGVGRVAQVWTQDSFGIEGNSEVGDIFGDALATGDFNKDGISDLAIGVSAEEINTVELVGAVNVIYGSSNGLSPTGLTLGNGRADQVWTQNTTNVEDDAESIDLFGSALATGDFNKDGISDLAIGVPLEDVDTIGNAGAVNVIYGSVRTDIDLGGLSATVPPLGIGRADQIWTQNSLDIEDSAESSDNFGSSLG
jgi:hypothetical protein